MKVIQSYWSQNLFNLLTSKSGWFAPEYNLMSWALSCLQLKKFYGETVLYADSVSAKMLIDVLQLPYTSVVCELDKLNVYHPYLWALSKIYAYAQQKSPFLHVDGDVFVWKAFDKKFLCGELIAQNKETDTGYYENMLKQLEDSLSFFPSEIKQERANTKPVFAYNAGIFGGNNINFFKTYTQKAFEFVNKNIHNLHKANVSNFNIFFEQYLFYCLAKQENIKINVLIDEVIGDNEYKGFGDFCEVPHNKQYLHLIGTYKRNKTVCEAMANRLRQDYPEYYYRIIALFKKTKTPLFKDYYYFVDGCTEPDLITRQNILKNEFSNNSLAKHNTELNKNIQQGNSVDLNIHPWLDEEHKTDLQKFCDDIQLVLESKFRLLSNDYLYGRDLNATQYCQYIFEDTKTIYEKVIVADDIIEIIESQFNWIEELNGKEEFLTPQIEEEPTLTYYTAIIPECDKTGFSADNIDELDILILQTLKKQHTIGHLFSALKNSFDAEELESSKDEFEKLIFGRIKKGLINKTIKCVMPLK